MNNTTLDIINTMFINDVYINVISVFGKYNGVVIDALESIDVVDKRFTKILVSNNNYKIQISKDLYKRNEDAILEDNRFFDRAVFTISLEVNVEKSNKVVRQRCGCISGIISYLYDFQSNERNDLNKVKKAIKRLNSDIITLESKLGSKLNSDLNLEEDKENFKQYYASGEEEDYICNWSAEHVQIYL